MHGPEVCCDIHQRWCYISHKTPPGCWCCGQAAWLLRVASCMDLTTLAGDDTLANVQRLCFKAKQPIRQDLIAAMGLEDLGQYVYLAFLLRMVTVFQNKELINCSCSH